MSKLRSQGELPAWLLGFGFGSLASFDSQQVIHDFEMKWQSC